MARKTLVLVVVAVVVVAAIASVVAYLVFTPQGNSGGTGGSGPGGGNGGGSQQIEGSFVYQPSETNYSVTGSSGGQAYGVLTASNGTHYKVLLGGSFAGSTPVAVQGAFGLSVDASLPGFYTITTFQPNTPSTIPSPFSEVNLTLNSVGVAAANLTLGVSTNPSTPYAYLAFGTYPTFFSNVTLQGVALNISTVGALLNVNLNWLTGLIHQVNPSLPTSFPYVLVVNQTIWLPNGHAISGQAQAIITPQEVSSFLSSVSSNQGNANSGQVTAALDQLDEELVAVATVAPGSVTYSFVLAPTELTRAALAGIVSLEVEESYVSVGVVAGTNQNISLPGSVVHVFIGVTWDKAPLTASGYTSNSVRGLWGIQTDQAVTVQAAAIGVSLSDAGNALQGMGYSEGQYLVDLASLQNPAVFVLIDPSLVQNLNESTSYSSYAVALVPNDQIPAQTSVDLYLTVQGVVYNTSYYLHACSRTNLPACPLLVADSISAGAPQHLLPYQLGGLTQPTFVNTTGFLSGTTVKNINGILSNPATYDYTELIQNSPIDVGFYDLGYSNGVAGYNLASVYLTWGKGHTLMVTNNITEGLYVPTSTVQVASYLSAYSSYLPGSGAASTVISTLQSYSGSARQFILNDVVNGSMPVPGVLLMMDLYGNSSQGTPVVLSSASAVAGGCWDNVSDCIVAQTSLSANSNLFIDPPSGTGFLINLNGAGGNVSDGTPRNCIDRGTSLLPTCWSPTSLPTPGYVDCLTALLCALTPYHVVNFTTTFCYRVALSGDPLCATMPISDYTFSSAGTYTLSFTLYWPWGALTGGTGIYTTPQIQVSIS